MGSTLFTTGTWCIMENPLKGKRIAITSGPTHAPIDAVRFISNRSTGALGLAIAELCLQKGACVTFFHGPGSLLPHLRKGLKIVEIETVNDLILALEKRLPLDRYDAFLHAMAVLDYVPETETKGKIPSGKQSLTLRLARPPQVINRIKQLSPQTILVGFKLEVGAPKESLRRSAKAMMAASQSDFVLANDLRTIEQGTHSGYLLDRKGGFLGPIEGKAAIAAAVVQAVETLMSSSSRPSPRKAN
jgi:phosphopantothenoylcysteine synthetase/decarboxylase